MPVERARRHQADELLLGDLARRGPGLLFVTWILHHEHRLAFGGQEPQACNAGVDAVGVVALAVAVLAVEQILAGKAVDRVPEPAVGEQRIAVLRDHQEAAAPGFTLLRDALDEFHHLLRAADVLEDVDAIEIDAVESGRHDPLEVIEDDRLPLRMPEAHRVIAGPLRVLAAEPLRRALRPIPAVRFGLADAHIGQHQAAGAVGLAAHGLDLAAGEEAVRTDRVDHRHVGGRAGDGLRIDARQLVVPALHRDRRHAGNGAADGRVRHWLDEIRIRRAGQAEDESLAGDECRGGLAHAGSPDTNRANNVAAGPGFLARLPGWR